MQRLKLSLFIILALILGFSYPVYSYFVKGSEVQLNSSGFSKNLSPAENNVQKAMDVLDQLEASGGQVDLSLYAQKTEIPSLETDPDSLHLNGDNANNYLYLSTTTYMKKDGNTVGLYVNNTLVQDWTVIPTAPVAGTYMGFGCMTYSGT